MGRGVGLVMGTAFAMALMAAPAKAQVHIDVGILTPSLGARVVVGRPRVHVVQRYYQPVYVPRGRYSSRDRDRYDRDRYDRDLREARRDYAREIREAQRDYRADLRDARRDYERDRRQGRRGRW